MRKYVWRIGDALIVLAMTVTAASVFLPSGFHAGDEHTPGAPAGGISGLITLSQPVFAAEGQLAGTNFLKEEAGISAFTNVGREIDLVRARRAFRTIEREGDEYIIGSVGVPGLPAAYDAHIFVHRDGWMLAYYGRKRPTAWIVDWRNLRTTKLEATLMQVATAAGVSIRDVSYYDFRHPEAEKMMIIIDNNSFNLKIPRAFTVFERSYSIQITRGARMDVRASFNIDETRVLFVEKIGIDRVNTTRRGTLTSAQLRPGEFHALTFRRGAARTIGGVIVLVYREE